MSSGRKDDFYVGYLPQMPQGTARFLRPIIALLILGALAISATLVINQNPFDRSVFEFGSSRTFEGIIQEHPYPALQVLRPGRNDSGLPAWSQYLLVDFGKSGAQQAVYGLDGKRVRLEGTLVYRDDQTMLELDSTSPLVLDDRPSGLPPMPGLATAQSLGRHTLTGEIVDSKCFFGVMNPGNLKPHQDCAIRCISGGIPPLVMVRNSAGLAVYYLLVGAEGNVLNREILPYVAVPLEVSGEVLRQGDLLLIKALISDIVRL